MGLVGLAGSFAGLDFFNSSSPSFDPTTTTLFTRSADGSLLSIAATNPGGQINAGCSLAGKLYFGGSFSSVQGVNASNIVSYDPSKDAFSALGDGGLDGNVTSLYCQTSSNALWVGGTFHGPSTSASSYAGSVAVYFPQNDSWSPPPFAGLDGPVLSITPSPSSSSLYFAGSFHTTFSSPNNTVVGNGTNNPNVPFSAGATPFSSSLVPIPLGAAQIDASPSTSQAQFSDIGNILCPAGADGPGNTWLARDASPALITIRTFDFLTANGIRLGNTFVQGRSTTAFTLTTLPNNQVLPLNYTDPTTGTVHTCTNDCPILQDKSIPYQDFVFTQVPQSLTGIQLSLTQWVGSGSGLHLLQILSDGAFASAVSSENGVSCFAPSASTTQQTGNWNPLVIDTTIAGTQQTVLTSTVSVGTPSSQGPTFTWKPYVSAPGQYDVNILIPGCVNSQDCPLRTSVDVTIFPGGGLQPWVSTVSQQVNQDTVQSIYTGPIFPTSPDFSTTITLALSQHPTGTGQGGQYELVADRVQLKLLSVNTTGQASGPGSSVGATSGSQSGFGFFEWQLNSTSSVNATSTLSNTTETLTDAIGFELSSTISSLSTAAIHAVAVHSSGTIYLGGSFNLSSGSSNVVAFSNGNLSSLENNGLNGVVSALAINDNTLYVGGSFTDTPSASSKGAFSGVVSYDISNNKWTALDAGVNGAVTSLLVSNGQLLVAGNFTRLLTSAGSSSGSSAGGFAAWNISSGTWSQSGGFISGSLTFVGNGTSSNEQVLAGNVASALKTGADGFAMLKNGGSNSPPTIVPLQVPLDDVLSTSSTSALRVRWPVVGQLSSLFSRQSGSPPSLPALSAPAPSVLDGAFWTNKSSSDQVVVIGGNFSFNSGSSVTPQGLAIYDPKSGHLTALQGSQPNGVVKSLFVQGNQLFVGGDFTLQGTSQGADGFAIYDLDNQEWDGTSVPALQGNPVVVRSITGSPSQSNLVYVAGSFTGVASVSNCAAICSWDIVGKQWKALGSGIQGEISSVAFAGSDLGLLIAAGSLSLNGQTANVAVFSISNSTWTPLGDVSQIPGPVLALEVNNGNSSSIFASGQSTSDNTPFLSFWNGQQWTLLNNSALGTSSVVQQLLMVPLVNKHAANSIIESDRMLMISGSLKSSNGTSSATLFDGQQFIPYLVTENDSGSSGSVSSFFHSLSTFTFNQHHFLATGVVILISIAIAAGIVFFLLLIGLLWMLFGHNDDRDQSKLDGSMTDDDASSLQRPSSLLEHINAATRTAILGAGVESPFNDAAARKYEEHRVSRLNDDADPFAAETTDGHDFIRAETPMEAGAGVGQAIGGEDAEPTRTRARYSFEASGEGELGISQGTVVDVLDTQDQAWWYCRDVTTGQEGVVPASYLY
ncbi:hypothetical protein SISSUDRAFT_1069414 [Sistotremastrum suecicum HHB10207 ss-3]|uniref:SH3 domain-containing protein n=1 Tax=Sistotremastrum suecicum HHB10207 ss-3 TaxID=1314776 RepID=A0A166H9K1_9AGAM|nr:hypothetical protein SISSUDRAFT_1069414 [Sistotremastrum suecicum HHB10207 ss-3]